MKILFVLLAGLFSIQAHAFTNVKFMGVIGMISMTDRVGGQTVDDDSPRLYAAMNVEPKDSNLGKGKTIKMADKSFTLVCALRPNGETVCTIVVKNGGNGKVSPGEKLLRFAIEGEPAAEFYKMFHPTGEGIFAYSTTDGYVKILSTPEKFMAEYSGQAN